jgi:hypothetical protein
MKKHLISKIGKALTFLVFSNIVLTQSIIAQVPTANSFSSSVAYNGIYRYGANPGWYGNNWSSENVAALSMGSSSLNVKGVGVKSLRIPLYDDHLTSYGINAEVSKFQYYASLGGGEMTAFVGNPSPANRETTTFPGSPEQAKTFKGLYEPIWLDAAQTQINPANTYAKYLYDVVKVYGTYIKFWEVINEPDYTYTGSGWMGDANPPQAGSWFDHNPTASELVNLRAPIQYYIRTLRISWEVIKKLQPNSYVCTGGIGYRSFLDAILRNTDNPVDGSVTSAYPAKGGAYFDVLSFHNYPMYGLKTWSNAINGFQFFRHSDGAAATFVNCRNNMESVLGTYGYNGSSYPKKQYICTETGVSRFSSGDDWGSPEGQKNYVIKAQVAAQKVGIRQIYWYTIGDQTGTSQYDQMGMYRYFGGSSPYNATLTDQGIASKTMSDQLYGKVYDASRTSSMNLPGNVDGGAFRGTDGSYVYVLWAKTQTDLSENASASFSFPSSVIMSGSVTRKDWNFSQTNSSSSTSSSNISLNGSPSFFVEGTGGGTTTTPTPVPTPTTTSPTPTTTTSGSATRIEAENWSNMSGVQTENTSDAGGGKDVGWIDNGDWMDYNVSVSTAGTYPVSFRVSSIYSGSQFQVKNSSGTVLATVNVPLTGGYQTFQTVSANINLSAGSQTIRIQSSASLGFNFNWFEVPGGSGTTTSTTPTTPTTTTSTSIKTEAENWSSMSGVQTENTSDAGGGKDVGWIDNGDWMDYSISTPSAGAYTVNFRLSSIYSGTQFQVKNSSGTVLATVNVPATGGFQTWQTTSATISLAAGTQTIRLQSISALGWNINWLEVVGSVSTTTTTSPTPTTTTSGSSTRIEAENWSNMSGVQTENTSDAGGGKDVGWIDNGDWMDYSVSVSSAGSYALSFRVSSIYSGSQFQVKNSSGTVLATVNVPLTGGYQTFQTVSANVNLNAGSQTIRIQSSASLGFNFNWFEVPGGSGTTTSTTPTTPTTTTSTSIKTEAENWSSMSGVQTENTSDAGGGKDVGWIDNGDWMDYSISTPSAGAYTVNFRIASIYSTSQFQLKNSAGTVLATVNVPSTGGYQVWKTISATINLPAGAQTLRIQSSSAQGFNFNWFELLSASAGLTMVQGSTSITDTSAPALDLSPNPTTDKFVLQVNNSLAGAVNVQVLNAAGVLQKQFSFSKSAGSTQFYISIGDLTAATYTIKVSMTGWTDSAQIVKQ